MRRWIAAVLGVAVVAVRCGGTTTDVGDGGDGDAGGCPSDPHVGDSCSVEGKTCSAPNLNCSGVASVAVCTSAHWAAPTNCYITTGCGMFTTTTSPVDPNSCTPQLESATSCNGAVCSWIVEVPCTIEAADGGSDGGSACQAWCNATAPSGEGPSSFCQTFADPDGGAAVFARCGGCGV